MAKLHGLIVLILPNVLAFSFVKPENRRFLVTGDNNIVTGNIIINNGNSGGSAGMCVDDSSCPQIMASYDICQNTATAWKLCPKLCNLCTGSGMKPSVTSAPVAPVSNGNCNDSSTKCHHLQVLYHICEYGPTATKCLKTCNLCNKPFDYNAACKDTTPGCWTTINMWRNKGIDACSRESNAKICPKSCNKC